jgi:hypothetical protein
MAIATQQIGEKFKNVCFIGLERVEYFPEKTTESITADTWQDVTDEQSRKHLALVFFSPRDLEGDHINPYIYLSETSEDVADETVVLTSQQMLQNIPLIDMCRVSKSKPNTVNILAVADVLFHWDVNDSYIQPTSPLTWVQDLKQIQSTYPKSTKFNLYTNWDEEKLAELKVKNTPIREMPLDTATWLNMPTFQEKYGWQVLILSILIASGAYGVTYYQNEKLQNLSDEIAMVEQDAPNTNKYSELARKFTEQEAFMRYRTLIPISFRDVASAIFHSGIKADSFELRGTELRDPYVNLLAIVNAKSGAYEGWLQEEPIAKSLLAQSVSMDGIRKRPGQSNVLQLEGLINLPKLENKLKSYRDQMNALSATTTPESGEPLPKDTALLEDSQSLNTTSQEEETPVQ